ncbi:SLAP domain-containing protein [Companilactobacillus nuruki]|nr:SLAP domain-containing protein [Companilactobacillus nuruki]
MKKYKMLALTGILLSSTILGVGVPVVQAATTINVDKSALNTAAQNNQTKFSDVKDGSTMSVAPIFGKKSSSEFAAALKKALNVVNDSSQLVDMSVVDTDSSTGFATKVKFTNNGTSKTVSVNYNYAKPTVTLANSTLNYKAGHLPDDYQTAVVNGAKAATTNGEDANGRGNTATISTDSTSNFLTDAGSHTITFTAKDNYATSDAVNETVNILEGPSWNDSELTKTIQKGDTTGIAQPTIVKDNGQTYSIAIKNLDTTLAQTATEGTPVKLVATAIDSKGNPLKDSSGTTLSWDATKDGNLIVTDDTDKVPYNIVYKSGNNIVGTYSGIGASGDEVNVDANKPAGYTLANSSDASYTIDSNAPTKVVNVNQSVGYTITYIDKDTGETVGTPTTGTANDGTYQFLTAPDGYNFVDVSDVIYKVDSSKPNKTVYVTKKSSILEDLNYTVTFKDKSTGKTVDTTTGTGSLGDYVSLTAPDGYAFSTLLDNGFLLLKDGQNVTKYVTAANTPYSVSYVDQDSGKEVGTQAGKGADGSTVTLTAPDGYAFVSADDVTYKIDKDTPSSKVYVQKSDQTVDNLVSGYPKNGYIKIYDQNGKLNNDVVLSEGSSWIIDKTLTIDGAEYYRVATDEYVKASDVYKYTPVQNIAVTNSKNPTGVYNSKGQLIIDRALAENTPWYTDRTATIRGQKMHRVATDEWVKDSDVTIK